MNKETIAIHNAKGQVVYRGTNHAKAIAALMLNPTNKISRGNNV